MAEAKGCGCGCDAQTPLTPEPVGNAPGLRRLNYRVAHHSSVKAAILQGLSDRDLPALAGLSTRDDADPAIALADGFAAMADVLTFYTERIAHESFLRTATERLSVLELSRLIGYRPDPGVAADAWLAFTVEEAKTLPHQPAPPVEVHTGTQVQSVPGQDEVPVTFETVAPILARAEWNAITPVRSRRPEKLVGRTSGHLQGTGHRLAPGDVILVLGADRVTSTASPEWETRPLVRVDEDAQLDITRISWTEQLTQDIPVAGAEIHVFRLRAPFFGHNAPDPRLLSTNGTALATLANIDTGTWNKFELPNDMLDLDQVYPHVVKGGWALVHNEKSRHLAHIDSVEFPSLSQFGLAAKVTRIIPDAQLPRDTFSRRGSVVLAQSERLPLAEDPMTSAVAGDMIELDGEVHLTPGQPVAVYGPAHAAPAGAEVLSEVALVADLDDAVVITNGTTRIRLARDLSRAYDRLAATVNANVAPATEGATVGEILGSGEATARGQAFVLKQRPLTWTAGESGREAALEVRVDDVAWHRDRTLYDADSRDRVYVVETRTDGSSVVRFGDGVEGARLPTGQANVRARYRTGLGSQGNVRTGQLTTLLSRPLGIASVGNPAPGTGGEDPEAIDQARQNAPVTVRTLDRVVSRLDVEDFARAFPGVLKASAAWITTGPARGVAVTLMGPDGAAIDESVRTHQRLLSALRAAGCDRLPIRLLSYVRVRLTVALRVLPSPDYESDAVIATVRRDLVAAFGFNTRELGQPSSIDEVITVVHRMPGVVAVDVDTLRRPDAPVGVDIQHRVPAHPGGLDPTGTAAVPAEFLTLQDADLTVEVMA